jgi:hypothetical protein
MTDAAKCGAIAVTEDITLALAPATPASNRGFLTVANDPSGYSGGYLVTNQWGRPLEFRLSTPVRPNRVQQILYAETLEPYICGDLIGKTLVEKTATAVQFVATDTVAALELRRRLDIPVVLLDSGSADFRVHPGYPQDRATVEELLAADGGGLNLTEPFIRIREAMAEARKTGTVNRG